MKKSKYKDPEYQKKYKRRPENKKKQLKYMKGYYIKNKIYYQEYYKFYNKNRDTEKKPLTVLQELELMKEKYPEKYQGPSSLQIDKEIFTVIFD